MRDPPSKPTLTPGQVLLIRCLTRVYESSEKLERSLPYPEFLNPPNGISTA